jgi:hypothetical protein
MALAARMFVITMCMNIMFTLAALSLGGNDALAQFLMIDNSTGQVNPTTAFSFAGNIPTETQQGYAPVTTSLSFIDGLRMTFNFILMLMVSLFFPMYWGFALGMPIFMQLLLFIMTGVSILSLIFAIRGIPT